MKKQEKNIQFTLVAKGMIQAYLDKFRMNRNDFNLKIEDISMQNGIYRSKNGIKYEIKNNQIIVKHKNGYEGCLYGETSMSIFKEGKEILHTGSRTPNTADELYKILDGMPDYMEKVKKIFEEDDV